MRNLYKDYKALGKLQTHLRKIGSTYQKPEIQAFVNLPHIWKIYIAGKTRLIRRHEKLSSFIKSKFESEIFLPHRLVDPRAPHHKLSRDAYQRCVDAMDASDLVVVDLELYGKDTAWEVGYCQGKGKIAIGVSGNAAYMEDFMVRGSLRAVARSEERLIELMEQYLGPRKPLAMIPAAVRQAKGRRVLLTSH